MTPDQYVKLRACMTSFSERDVALIEVRVPTHLDQATCQISDVDGGRRYLNGNTILGAVIAASRLVDDWIGRPQGLAKEILDTADVGDNGAFEKLSDLVSHVRVSSMSRFMKRYCDRIIAQDRRSVDDASRIQAAYDKAFQGCGGCPCAVCHDRGTFGKTKQRALETDSRVSRV